MCVCSVYSCVCVRSTATLESASYVTPPCACITPRTLWWLRHTSTTWRLGVPVAAHASPFSGGPTDQAPSCCAYRGCHTLLLCLPWVPHPLAVLTVGATPSCCACRGCHTLLASTCAERRSLRNQLRHSNPSRCWKPLLAAVLCTCVLTHGSQPPACPHKEGAPASSLCGPCYRQPCGPCYCQL